MSRRWVTNASPLILLGKADRANLLTELCDELIIPDAVVREVGSKPDGLRTLERVRAAPGVRCAAALEVPVIGTLGVVLRARRQGEIPAARPVLDEVQRAGLYFSPELVEQALEHLGE